MSGIFGIIRVPGCTVTDADLAPMAAILKHRGPDGIHCLARRNAGVGQCMLHSTAESLHEILPFRDEASGLTLTADARIDNRRELLAALALRPATGEVITDSQLILHAYRKWGERCPGHLLGDFAFAIWDERAETLFVARDRMGCRPFYYHCSDGLFVFASSALAVTRVPEVKATLNEGRVADFLVQELEGIDKTCSWFNEISRMPPAHCGRFRGNAFNSWQYWELQPAEMSHLKTDDDYLQAFTEVYTEAIRCRLRCQTEPASMLSGGLDSSTIVAIARDLVQSEGRSPLRTFSAVAESQRHNCPETGSINAILAQGNVRSICLSPSQSLQYGERLTATLASGEDPFDTIMTIPGLMFLLAAEYGHPAVLDGVDGDLALGFTTVYPAYLMRDGQWRGAWVESAALSQHYYRGRYSRAKLYLSALSGALVPDFFRHLKRPCVRGYRCRRLLQSKRIHKQFFRKIDLLGRFGKYDDTLFQGLRENLDIAHLQTLQVPYLTAAIERYERTSGLFGVEARHPLLDARLLEFSVGLPWSQKARHGWSKFILRRLADRRLPDSVAWREGWEHLGWHFTTAILEEFKDTWVGAAAYSDRTLGGYLDLNDHRRSNFDTASRTDHSRYYFDLWQFYGVEKWLKNLATGR